MAGIKISNLLEISNVQPGDFLPVARGGTETYKTPANQFIVQGQNLGNGGQFYISETPPLFNNRRTMRFRTLSAVGEGVSLSITENTVVLNLSSTYTPTVGRHFGNGTQRTFLIPTSGSVSPNPVNYRVDVDGILQEPIRDYTIQGSNINFVSQAPPLGSKIVIVANNLTRTVDTIPADRSVTTEKVAFTAPTVLTTNYTLQSSDYLKTICTNRTVSSVILIPASLNTPGFSTTFIQLSTGQTTISADSGVTIRSLSGLKLRQQNAVANIIYINAAFGWVLNGDTVQ